MKKSLCAGTFGRFLAWVFIGMSITASAQTNAPVTFDTPKSSSFASGWQPGRLAKNTLSGLMSRWTIPFS